jgi:hypothetical protein
MYAAAWKEIEYLRKEIDNRTRDQSTLERNIVVGIAGIYAALATVRILDEQVAASGSLLWCVPILLSIGGAARFYDNHRVIGLIGTYILELEAHLKPIGGGWQHFNKRPHRAGRHWWTIRINSWWVLVFITVAVPFALWWLRSAPAQSYGYS